MHGQSDYWRRTLADAPVLLELPTDHRRPAEQDYAGGLLPLELDASLTAALKRLSERHGVTLFMTLLAGWSAGAGKARRQRGMWSSARLPPTGDARRSSR